MYLGLAAERLGMCGSRTELCGNEITLTSEKRISSFWASGVLATKQTNVKAAANKTMGISEGEAMLA